MSEFSVAGACALVLFAAVPALAADDAAPDRATIIVTANRLDEAARARIDKVSGGADLVTADALRSRVNVSLRDALAFSPGVYAQPRFGQEVRLSIRGSGISRGFHMRGLMLFQDGVPINLADNNGDFQELDPQVFERIEVYRGGNALRLGGSTLGGAIDAITPTGRTQPGVALRIDGGSYGTLRTLAQAGLATARGDGYVALTTDRADGDRDHSRRRALRFNGNAGVRLTDTVETRFYATLSDIDQRLPGALTRAQALATPKLSQPSNIIGDQQRDINSIRLANRTSVELAHGTLVFGAFMNDKQLFHPIFQVVDQKSVDWGGFARLDLAGELAGLPVEASLGTTARFGTVQNRQYLNVGGRRGAQTLDGRQEAHTIDSYGELRVTPVPRLTLIAGGLLTDGQRTVLNYTDPNRSGRASFDAFSPKFGVLYAPVAGVQVYANYSRSVELPGFIELSQTPFAVGGILTPGFVPVAAQRAWTAEIGTRGTIGIASWDITAYRATIRGELLQFDQAPDVPAATFNADRTRHQGIEAGLTLALSPWARLRQVYQLNDFRFRGDRQFGNNRLPVIARQLYRAELKLGTERLSVTPNVEWVPQGAWADYRNTVRAPGYVLAGLRAEATIARGPTLFLDARNIGNVRAIGDISAAVLATPASAIWYPVERRAIYGGARIQL